MVLLARCKAILDELTPTTFNGDLWNILQWTHISRNVAVGFFNYLYGGVFDLNLELVEQWEEAKLIGLKYGLDKWTSYVQSLKNDFDQSIS